MGKAVEITRLELSAADLRGHASKTRDGQIVRRLLAIAMVLEGASREAAADRSGMDRQTLRDWVHRYNADGIPGLASRTGGGPAPALTEQQMAELKAIVLKGPNPETDHVVRWRCVDLRQVIARRWSVTLHERTVGKVLHKLALTRLQPRPFHPKKDAEAQEAFQKTSPSLPAPLCPRRSLAR
jgi:putative transposase